MTNSELLSAKPLLNQKTKTIILAIILVSFLGFLDAGYLTIKHYTGTPIACSIFEDCEKVTTSPYAIIFNIPVALLGAVFYLAIFFSAIFYLTSERPRLINLIFALSIIAFLASIYFVYLQLFVIEAICSYCLVSAGSATVLFISSLLLKWFYLRQN